MSNIKVYVEGNPEAVAKFFREMGHGQYFAPTVELMGEITGETLFPISRKGELGIQEGALKGNAETVEVEIKNISGNSAPQTAIEKAMEEVAESFKENTKDKSRKTGVSPDLAKPYGKSVEYKTTEGVKLPAPQFEDSAPDFSDLPKAKEEAPEPEKPGHSREEVKAVLGEYGTWVLQQGIDRKSARPYLVALLKKFGEGATGTPELEEKCFDAVFEAAKNRVPLAELEEYL